MQNPFNVFLLCKFANFLKIKYDSQSILGQYQALTIIYMNLSILTMLIPWNIAIWAGLQFPTKGVNSVTIPLILTSFYFLRLGKQDYAALSVLGYFHANTFIVTKLCNCALTGLLANLMFPTFSILLSSSRKVYIFNFLFCIFQYFFLVFQVHNTFKVTFTKDQADEITQIKLFGFMGLLLVGSVSFFHKTIYTNLWQLAQSSYEKAEKINKEVIQAIEAKDIFISSLSHEVRNPLNAMKGSIDYLLKTVKDPDALKVLENAHLSSEVLLNLFNNVLDAAKLKHDKMELFYIETNIIETIKKVIIVHAERLKEKQIFTQVFLDRSMPKTLWVDSSRLLQIAINLFSNAFKFSPKGARIRLYVKWCKKTADRNILLKQIYTDNNISLNNRYEIQINTLNNIFEEDNSHTSKSSLKENKYIQVKAFQSQSLEQLITRNTEANKSYFIWNIISGDVNAHQSFDNYLSPTYPREIFKNGYLKIQITDTGHGVPEDQLPNLFSMFHQVNGKSSSMHGGSGLGLWICKQLCQKMGGDIALYSQVNKGTSVVFYLPINNDHLSSESIPNISAINPFDKYIRALVVDDFSYNRDIHRLLLEREGVRVDIACDGNEAVEHYIKKGEGYYDLVLMDIQMPNMDGPTAAKKIREWETEKDWKRVCFYFVSGEYYNEQDLIGKLSVKKDSEKNSEIRCLRKPVDVEIIRKIVNKFHHQKKEAIS